MAFILSYQCRKYLPDPLQRADCEPCVITRSSLAVGKDNQIGSRIAYLGGSFRMTAKCTRCYTHLCFLLRSLGLAVGIIMQLSPQLVSNLTGASAVTFTPGERALETTEHQPASVKRRNRIAGGSWAC